MLRPFLIMNLFVRFDDAMFNLHSAVLTTYIRKHIIIVYLHSHAFKSTINWERISRFFLSDYKLFVLAVETNKTSNLTISSVFKLSLFKYSTKLLTLKISSEFGEKITNSNNTLASKNKDF